MPSDIRYGLLVLGTGVAGTHQADLDSLLSTVSLRSSHRRATWCNAGAASYAIAFGAKNAPNMIARLPDPLSAHHFALVSLTIKHQCGQSIIG